MIREFNVVIEKDSDGYFVASIPNLRRNYKLISILRKKALSSSLIEVFLESALTLR